MEERTQTTILFSDVVGSTAYFSNYGDTMGVAMLSRHDVLVGAVVAEFSGRVIKTIGDAVMAEFPSPSAGAQAASVMQRRMAAVNAKLPVRDRIQLRIAVHFGRCIRRDHDLYGDAVNLCARLCKVGHPAQILTTAPVQTASGQEDLNYRPAGAMALAGRSATVEVYEVIWTGADEYDDIVGEARRQQERGEIAARDEDDLASQSEEPAGTPPPQAHRQPWLLAATVVVTVLASAAAIWRLHPETVIQPARVDPPAPVRLKTPDPARDAVPAPIGARPEDLVGAPGVAQEPPAPRSVRAGPLTKGMGRLRITSDPPGAWITLDGQDTGLRTDTDIGLSAGKHRLEMTRTGFETVKATVTIRPNQITEFSRKLEVWK